LDEISDAVIVILRLGEETSARRGRRARGETTGVSGCSGGGDAERRQLPHEASAIDVATHIRINEFDLAHAFCTSIARSALVDAPHASVCSRPLHPVPHKTAGFGYAYHSIYPKLCKGARSWTHAPPAVVFLSSCGAPSSCSTASRTLARGTSWKYSVRFKIGSWSRTRFDSRM